MGILFLIVGGLILYWCYEHSQLPHGTGARLYYEHGGKILCFGLGLCGLGITNL
jgi:hypothetical protein